MAIGALANVLAATAPDRALSLLVEHLESMEAQGYQSATTLTQAVVVAARLGNEPLTLRLARRAMPLLHWWANYPFMLGVFNFVRPSPRQDSTRHRGPLSRMRTQYRANDSHATFSRDSPGIHQHQ